MLLWLKLWLGALSIPGQFDALELCAVEELATVFETRFDVGLDFSIIISSLVPSCILFDIVGGQLAELKMLILNKRRRWFHSSRVKLPFVRMSASWFLVSTYLIWIFGPWLILSNNQSSATLSVRGHVSHCGTSAFWWSSWSPLHYLKNVKQGARTRRFHVLGDILDIEYLQVIVTNWVLIWVLVCLLDGSLRSMSHRACSLGPVAWLEEECNTSIKPNSRDRERKFHPCVNLHPTTWFQIPSNCVRLKSVSYTSNLLEQTCDFENAPESAWCWLLNPQDILQNRSLETVPICFVLQCFPHDNIVCKYMYDECKRSNEIIVVTRFGPFLWSIVQVCSLTVEYRAHQYERNTDISQKFVSKQ